MTKMTCDDFPPISNMSDISFVMGMFSIKTICIPQWLQWISMISRPFILLFSLKDGMKIIAQGVHHILTITCDEGIECYHNAI